MATMELNFNCPHCGKPYSKKVPYGKNLNMKRQCGSCKKHVDI